MGSNIAGVCKAERTGCVAFAYVLDYTVGITALVLLEEISISVFEKLHFNMTGNFHIFTIQF